MAKAQADALKPSIPQLPKNIKIFYAQMQQASAWHQALDRRVVFADTGLDAQVRKILQTRLEQSSGPADRLSFLLALGQQQTMTSAALFDEDPRVRLAATMWLSRMSPRPKEVATVLERLARDPEETISKAAQEVPKPY